MKNKVTIILIIIISIFVVGCSNQDDDAFEVSFDGTMDHVHGLGYAGNDEGLYFASHTGLKIYRDGKWFETSNNFNDYMGFAAVDKGFYSSGHPGTDSKLPNPIGLQKSFDGGKTLEKIDFEGESDFHVMAVGYNSHDVILLNEQKNSKLGVGIYLSEDSGESWTEVTASRLDGDILSFSIHPSNSEYIAAATNSGIYFSSDKGESFTLISEGEAVGTAVFFNEENLYFASYKTNPKFVKYKINNGETEKMNLPELYDDGPVFITQSPKDTNQLAIYTIKGQAYVSSDFSETWEQILVDNEVQ
ncbi:MAG TPA: hypothetical protein VK073_05290 [Pseudogracilibacillus sp.]|nr:hypothetical protein [Pseudogracilibacillus sp.]